VAGAGSAGLGVAAALRQGMVMQGLTEEEAQARFFVCDQFGLLAKSRAGALTPEQLPFARDDLPDGLSLEDTVKEVKPSILLGLSGVGGVFTEAVVSEVAKHHDRPIVFPLSNPTSAAECTAEQAYDWTGGTAVFASGSPFDTFMRDGDEITTSQCNNMFIFPGIGLGAVLCGATVITDGMLFAAANALADSLTPRMHKKGMVFPPIDTIREVSASVAAAVIREAVETGKSTQEVDMDDTLEFVRSRMYDPQYVQMAASRNEFLAKSPKYGSGMLEVEPPPPANGKPPPSWMMSSLHMP